MFLIGQDLVQSLKKNYKKNYKIKSGTEGVMQSLGT